MTSAYQQQLAEKVERIQQQFQVFQAPPLQVFPSAEQNFRMRAEFRIWHQEDDLFYAMFERSPDQKQKIVQRIEQFPIAHQSINQLMPILLTEIKNNLHLSKRLFEIHFLCTLHGDMLVSLIYHRQLDADWHSAAATLAQQLNINLIGRCRGEKYVFGEQFVLEQLTVSARDYCYKQYENSFTQPNAVVCQSMLQWAVDAIAGDNQDLLELYCGNGNFTLPLSTQFNKVLATELAKSSVQAAQWNIARNHIENIKVARLSAEEFSQAFRGERQFRRLQEADIALADYQFDTIFVDPPRAGIDADTLALMQQFPKILYISCNPDTLYDNLQQLCKTHKIVQFALFDQFPYTHHVESGVLLEKVTT
ncbi:tRNA (uridine(54)-C5)-methyltransferase TrmA [Acinetobacter larvae]|uniref:tRNA/tmRNA (uracil-C(5))-methyltransferase n=1 Tax=Acinetobacter larvae TaxID=1789224 RepID=A0A1B2M157_9GAMM|nr:tRNA (uridine(54)-C5)-methyltransferase TrmA [Acinetobacter larvae]AOA58753.1 tRNA (uridine(54)-C5)-methyltransferase TrmA [Acinetobacter larvae]